MRQFDKKSIKTRLILIFMITSVLPILLVNVVYYYHTSRLIRENIERMTRDNLQQTKAALNVWLESYEDILFQVYTDDAIVELIDKINRGEDITNNRKLLRKMLRGLFWAKDCVKSISIITESGELVFYDLLTASTTNTSWMNSFSMSREELYQMISRDNKTHLISTGKEIMYGSNSYHLFHIGHRIIDYRDIEKQCGIVIVSIDEELLKEICSSTTEGGLNFIADQKGMVVSCLDSEEIGKPLFLENSSEKEKTAAYQKLARKMGILGNGKISIYTVYDEETGWTIVRATNQEELVGRVYKQQQLLMWVTFVSLLTVLILIIGQVSGMTSSIKEVVDTMKKAGRGDLSVKVRPDAARPTEIDVIAEEFNATMDKLKISVDKQKDAEIKALEAQINPHFLYNTLDTINWMAIDKDEYEISNTITALADILRYGIANSNAIVTIREEAKWLRQYIFLQQTRLKNTFECNMDIEPEVMEKPIHKLLLQPFIENAILHGFEGMDERCILNVKISAEEDYLKISIEDNGCGMSEKMAEQFQAGIFQKTGEKNHIGMENAITRIRMYYGEKARFTIKSRPQEGTRVRIWIPAAEGDKRDESDHSGR